MKWRIIYTLFLVGLFFICLTGRRTTRPTAKSIPVSLINQGIYAPGRVEGNSAEIELFARTLEPVTSIAIREGDSVQKGDLIIQLDDRSYQAEVEFAKAGVQLAQAERDRLKNGALPSEIDEARHQCEYRDAELYAAHRMRQRSLLLAPTGAISQEEIDQNESNAASAYALFEAANARLATISAPPRADDLQIAEAKLASAQAKLHRAEAALARTQIRAPSDGLILKIDVEVGELTSEQPMVIMSDTRALQVRASVDEFDALRVSVGLPVTMTTNALPGQVFSGRVSRVSPRMDHKQVFSERPDAKLDTRAREIWVDVERNSPLLVGLPMEIWIGDDSASNPHQASLPIRSGPSKNR